MRSLFALFALVLVAMPAQAQLAAFNDAGLTYGHVHVNVPDVAAQIELLTEHFGGEVAAPGPLQTIKYPGMLIVFNEREPTEGSQATVMDHFGFKVRDIDSILEGWRAAGLEVQSEFTGAEGFPNAYLVTPDGIRIELQEDPEQEEDVVAYHIHFLTPDYEELMAWYVDIFGVEPFQRGSIATTANAPGMNLSFGNSDTPRNATQGAAIDHIGFEVEDLDAFAEGLRAKGIEFDLEPREIGSIFLKIAYLTDPSGVRIELTEGFNEY